jgi:hypothetical protein
MCIEYMGDGWGSEGGGLKTPVPEKEWTKEGTNEWTRNETKLIYLPSYKVNLLNKVLSLIILLFFSENP